MAGGRPTKMTEAVLLKLDEAFLMGCTDREACLFADISPSTLYKYAEENPEYSERKETLKQNPFMLARKVQLNDLTEGNSQIAQKVLDRRDGSKVALSGADGGPIQIARIERVIVSPSNPNG